MVVPYKRSMRIWLNHGITHALVIPKRAFFFSPSVEIYKKDSLSTVNQSVISRRYAGPPRPLPTQPFRHKQTPFLKTFVILILEIIWNSLCNNISSFMILTFELLVNMLCLNMMVFYEYITSYKYNIEHNIIFMWSI